MQHILRFVPAASHILLRILDNAFPHQSDTRRAHIVYSKNLLQLLHYAPELREEVLALITDRLVKIDVQVQEDLEELAEELSEGIVQGLPNIEQPESWEDLASEDEVDDIDVQDEELRRMMNVRKNVQKMDVIMALLFKHYDSEISQTSVLGGQDVLDTLLSQFVRTILPVQRSRHTQFLLFHFAQLSSQFMDTFVGTCIEIAFDQRQPIIIRHSAAAYLASFVARGAHISPAVVRDVYDYLGQELTALRKAYEPTCRGPDLWRYTSYYNLVQSVLYIFCFRWHDLEYNLEDDGEDEEIPTKLNPDHEWRRGVKDILSQNLFSRLNPLKVCSPAIVSEFARIAKHLGVMYVYHLLETNKRIRVSHHTNFWKNSAGYAQVNQGTAMPKQMGEAHQHLDAFFPFDPYNLPRSKKWIESDYREWKGIPGLDDESEDDAEDSEDGFLEDMVRDDITESTEDVKETP